MSSGLIDSAVANGAKGSVTAGAGNGNMTGPALKAVKRAVKKGVAVVPGRFVIAAFSPRLNEAGNSVRAQQAIRYIAAELGVGIFGLNPD